MSNTTLTEVISLNAADEDRGRSDGESLFSVRKDALRSSLSVLPVVASQLQEVAKHVEEAVVKVCDSFQCMIQRARQATAHAPQLDDSPEEKNVAGKVGINHLISDTRETMGDLLGRIEHTSTFSSQMVDRLNEMERQIEGLTQTLGDIDEVAKNSRLLALNGQLEAARAGEQGAAFAIVATETAKMAVHAVDSSKKIRKMIGTISESINGASAELKYRAMTDIREADLSRKEVNCTLDDMTALHDDMQSAIDQSNDNSQQLARDISDAVMAMQFQDAVSQRIEHVVHILQEVHETVCKQLDGEGTGVFRHDAPAAEDWASRMAKKYTMAAEYKILATHSASHGIQAEQFGNNVELF
jgi:methyl-accepting chemotaxis protein